ncbi:MAG: Hpt domain-containing protein [Desulfovibrionaceae bacterium]
MSERIFQAEAILQGVGDDEELARELLQAYSEDAPLRLEALRRAIADDDAEAASRTAHSLKGMSGVVRIRVLADMSLGMELTARGGDMDGVRQRFPLLEATLAQALGEIGAYLRQPA